MGRLFAFGCSFTQYWRWPTWADILGKQFNGYQNWGICGGGNSVIFNSLLECQARNKIQPNDTVIIMWTSTSREDHYVGKSWQGLGNIYWSAGSEYPEEYVKKFACERGYLIRDLAYVSAARQLLESYQCRWKFLSMIPLGQTNEQSGLGFNPFDSKNNNQDVLDLYKDDLATIGPSVYETVFLNNWTSRPGLPDSYDPTRRDFHPTPEEHLIYLNKVLPEFAPTTEHQNWVYDVQSKLQSNSYTWRNPNTPKRL